MNNEKMTLIDTINELCETYVNPFLTGAFYYYAHPTIVRLEEYYENLPRYIKRREKIKNSFHIGEYACGWFTGVFAAENIHSFEQSDSKQLIALLLTIIISNSVSKTYEHLRKKE